MRDQITIEHIKEVLKLIDNFVLTICENCQVGNCDECISGTDIDVTSKKLFEHYRKINAIKKKK